MFAPPALVVIGLAISPWIVGIDLRIMQPASAEGQFYGDIFQRRTGKPLAYLSGDPRLAPLIALAAPNRPHVYFAWAPHRSLGQPRRFPHPRRHPRLAGRRQHRNASRDAQDTVS
jgi:hypothetical protein